MQRIDQPNNNSSLINTTNGVSAYQQSLGTFQTELSKIAATGTRFSVSNNTTYNANNATLNTFSTSWAVQYKWKPAIPCCKAGGSTSTASPARRRFPGFTPGCCLGRINTDISLTEFELGSQSGQRCGKRLSRFVLRLPRFGCQIAARDAALETWRKVNALYELERKGGEAFREAQAREQYFRFQEEVQNSMQGKLLEGTRGNNGSSGGTFRAGGGVLVAERRLRLLLGIPISDTELLRPAEEPEMAEVVFDWDEVLQEALSRRVEIRRQKWNVKSRQLEIKRRQKLPVASARLGGPLQLERLRSRSVPATQPGCRHKGSDRPESEPAVPLSKLAISTMPMTTCSAAISKAGQRGSNFRCRSGFRRGHAAVTNAEFRLARDVAILRGKNAKSSTTSAMRLRKPSGHTRWSRRTTTAAWPPSSNWTPSEAAYKADTAGAELDEVLDAQRRLADASTNYYRSLIEYASSIKNVHYEKGSLLDYNGIYLEEGPWPQKAYKDAREKEKLRSNPWSFWGPLRQGKIITSGPIPQLTLPQAGMSWHPDEPPVTAPAPNSEPGKESQPATEGGESKPPAPEGTGNVSFQQDGTNWEALKPAPQTQAPNLPDNPFAGG